MHFYSSEMKCRNFSLKERPLRCARTEMSLGGFTIFSCFCPLYRNSSQSEKRKVCMRRMGRENDEINLTRFSFQFATHVFLFLFSSTSRLTLIIMLGTF